MARKVPTPKTVLEAARLCYLVIFRPAQFAREEEEDNVLLNAGPDVLETPPVYEVRRGYVESLSACLLSLAAGAFCGYVLFHTLGRQVYVAVAVAIIGAIMLLWATLAVRGWEIQTHSGVTLSERVNQWLFRTLCVSGTFLTVVGTVWSVA